MGEGLTRKLGPLPVWAWALLALVVGYFLFRRFSPASSPATANTSSSAQPQAAPTSSLGLTPTAGSPADTGQTTSDLVSALGGQQASLLAALEQSSQDVLSLAQSQIAAAQSQTALGSFQTQTQPAISAQPATGNAPQIIYLSPTLAGTPSTPTGGTATVRSTTTTPTRYYTYKSQVPLGPGQTLHFTTGRGYYAA